MTTGHRLFPASTRRDGDPYAPADLGGCAWDFLRDPHLLVVAPCGDVAGRLVARLSRDLADRGLRVEVADPDAGPVETVAAFHAGHRAEFDADRVHLAGHRFLAVPDMPALADAHPDLVALVADVARNGFATGHHLLLAYPVRPLPGLDDTALAEFARLTLATAMTAPVPDPRPAIGWLATTAAARPVRIDPDPAD
ncbi:hypothetical protein [Streptomyces sp. NRRL S-495]|uniref:hypothetical protein n=1 Tax=Streptomyces sp. NRRL S-495 TaxID=1609133 RepID=UPI0005F8B71E|nr:hypothetical protein [Streptomyces sp. NRRL S-495]KJY24233.1 hypothetical protein VR45_41260 [Streptomyces sp. NRRL S-495]